ncbi:MAG: two-component system, OmpR family, response regulator ResD [Actinomycetota bacterium]|nr:two-component system, OmpR family, response regulator ResD [Actinomycetota bacterium]
MVDDEPSLRHLLKAYLVKEGFEVIEAATGEQALSVLRGGGVDLALVDLMLPELDGFEVVRRIRAQSSVPIILVTARGEETNRVSGLELGADDYVVKPFSAPEVVARVRAHLRRARGFEEAASLLLVGDVQVDRSSRRCSINGREVELTRREFDLLQVLSENAGRALTREQLLDAAWGTAFVSSKTVDVHVSALRHKLGDAVRITALRGIGYRLEAP